MQAGSGASNGRFYFNASCIAALIGATGWMTAQALVPVWAGSMTAAALGMIMLALWSNARMSARDEKIKPLMTFDKTALRVVGKSETVIAWNDVQSVQLVFTRTRDTDNDPRSHAEIAVEFIDRTDGGAATRQIILPPSAELPIDVLSVRLQSEMLRARSRRMAAMIDREFAADDNGFDGARLKLPQAV